MSAGSMNIANRLYLVCVGNSSVHGSLFQEFIATDTMLETIRHLFLDN